MSADSPRRNARGIPAIVPPQVVSDRSIIDSVAGFINDVTLNHQPQCDPKDTITWARFETAADISDSRFCDDWELEGNVAPPLLLILGYGQGVQVWAIPANGEAIEVLSWRHGIVSALRVLPTPSYAENGRADEPIDAYADKRPLMAICDGTTPAGSNPQFCAVNFVSLKTGTQVKTIKFKNPVLDILANRSSIVITFHERIAVFDARSLEDRLSVTTCFPSPGINPNPVALGTRWMAYSENKLLHSKRSGGGCDGDGVSSYTATVLNAAKSFGKGLRELGEQVAAGLTGTTGSGSSSKSSSFDSATGDVRQPGVVTILDIKNPIKDVSPTSGTPISINGSDPIVAHFIAHSEAVVAMEFDNSGLMLLTADRRGHDFHLFRIQPHPVGSSLAAVHHLYVLHRGDTSAKVQNIAFSLDSRWVAVSTLRGTTHVFPITPYGGSAGVRTHTSLHVVNKLSRFHRSAGLSADGRSSSPISHSDSTNFSQTLMPYHNPTLPPFPRPTVVLPLAQLRQPFALGSPPGSAVQSSYSKTNSTRQRLSSLSDDNGKPLSVCAVFAKSRSWLLDPPNVAREAPHKVQRKAVDSLFVMAGHGALIQYDLDTKLATSVAKEKICDETPIELEVEAKAQWNLGRKDGSLEIIPPLLLDNWLIKDKNACMLIDSSRQYEDSDDRCDSWLSQVEIITHAGPHRRLWMGPQFVFKTYNTPSGSNLSHIDVEAVEIGVSPGSSSTCRPERSSPLNMPLTATGRSAVPVLIESGSYSSIEQSPKLMDRFRHEHMNSDFSVAHGDNRLKEDLADAMRESPSGANKDSGRPQRNRHFAAGSSRATASSSPSSSPKASGSGGVSSASSSSSSAVTLVGCGGISSTSTEPAGFNSQYESVESLVQQEQQQHMKTVSIEKVVNPLGTVTTITGSYDIDPETDDVLKGINAQSYVIHENCDESLFRPVVAIFCDEKVEIDQLQNSEYTKPPEAIGNKLIVPVIEKSVDLELTKKESLKNRGRRQPQQQIQQVKEESDDEVVKFNIADVKKKQKTDKRKLSKEEPTKKHQNEERDAKEQSPIKIVAKVTEEIPKTGSIGPKGKSKKNQEKEICKNKDVDVKLKETKSPKSMEKSLQGEEIAEEVMRKKDTDLKHLKIRKSADKTADEQLLKEEETIKETMSTPIDMHLKEIKKRGSIEKTLPDTKTIPETPLDQTYNPSEPSTLKTRKSLEKEILPSEKSVSQKAWESKDFRSDCSRKSSGELSVKKVAEANKATLYRHKSEEKELSTAKISLNKEVKLKKKDSSESETGKIKTEKNTDNDAVEKFLAQEENEEKPIDFKRMTVVSPVNMKITMKNTKIENTSPTKAFPKVKGKILQEAEVMCSKNASNKIESRSQSPETKVVEIDVKDSSQLVSSKRMSKRERKKYKSDDKALEIPLAVELANASDLADSLLDFIPDGIEEVDNLKKPKDDELIIIKPNKDNSKIDETLPSTSLIIASDNDLKKLSKKSKIRRNSPPSQDTVKVLTKDTDTVITVEEKTTEEHVNSSLGLKETKIKSRKKSKTEVITPDFVQKLNIKIKDTHNPDKLSEDKETSRTPDDVSSDSHSPPSVSYKIKTDFEILKNDKQKKLDDGIANKVCIKPLESESFLSDLMDSQIVTKDKSSLSKPEKSEELSKKTSGSPLKFVDTYADKFVDSEILLRKGKAKTKSGKFEKQSDKTEVPSSEENKSCDGMQFFDTFLQESSPIQVESVTPWKPMSDVIEKPKSLNTEFPTLGKSSKSKKSASQQAEKSQKPNAAVTIDITNEKNKNEKPLTSLTNFLDDVPILSPLENLPADFLPPLNPLEPLEVTDENISLINFESPLQEASKIIDSKQESSPQFPKGFPADNIIFALCGSLHYENENSGKPIDSPLTLSFSDSTAHTTAEYKSLTENDEQYLSLEHSSQENVQSTSSSTCEDVTEAASSSGCGDKPLSLDKTKSKQRRKKQQLITAAPDDDEELRPLISKSDDTNQISTSMTVISKSKPSDKSTISVKKETLPKLDNNQVNSDSSSSSDQAMTSEDADEQIFLNVNESGKSDDASINNKSAEDDGANMAASIQSPIQPASQQSQQQPNSSKKKLKRRKNQVNQQHHTTEGGKQSIDHIDGGDLSSSSVSSGSRASLDPPSSSPTISITGDNLMHFPADSSGSL